IFGDQWHTTQIADLRHDTGRIVALAAMAAVVVAAAALTFRRWPVALPLPIIATLPFRIPLHAGGDQANLLVPLYLVIAAGVASYAVSQFFATPPPVTGPGGRSTIWLPR